MPYVEIDGEKTYYSFGKSDAGKALLLIHGSGGDHMVWPWKLLRLPSAEVYAVDLPGHGKSSGRGRQSVEDYADFVEKFVSTLDIGNLTLAGHSLGGAIVQTLALRSPKWLDKIILAGTSARLRVMPKLLNGILDDFDKAADLICGLAFGPAADESMLENARKALLQNDPETVHGDYTACDRFDVTGRVGNISISTLIIAGTLDRLTPMKYSEYLHKRIPGAQILVIENCGHMMALEKPDEFAKGISDFLETKTGN